MIAHWLISAARLLKLIPNLHPTYPNLNKRGDKDGDVYLHTHFVIINVIPVDLDD
jgi:hypothetical protein